MLPKPLPASELQVAVFSGEPHAVQHLLNDWLEKAGAITTVHDIQIQQGDNTTVAMIIFKKRTQR
ncbi:MAG: hypothetical protein V1894_00610 [Chloroflexota bacterium]